MAIFLRLSIASSLSAGPCLSSLQISLWLHAPCAWYQLFVSFVATLGFVYKSRSHVAYLLLYVGDIVLTAPDASFLCHIMHMLAHEFSMTDLGPLHYFLGISFSRNSGGLFLSQK